MPLFRRFTSICILASSFIFTSPSAQAEIHSHLQWFDSHGEIMNLDWPVAVQWVWAQDHTPSAQAIITVPEQLHLSIVDESQAKFVNVVPDGEGKFSNRTLVVEMEAPRKTIQLKKLDVDSAAKEIGLTIVLTTNTPNIIPSESCEKENISIEPRQDHANFLFLAASCKMIQAGLKISLETSHDALLGNDNDETIDHHFVTNPLVILIPKKNLANLKKDSVAATIRVQGENAPVLTNQFELVYTKENEPEDVTTLPVKPLKTADDLNNSAPHPWVTSGELNLGFLGYLQDHRSAPGLNPSEFNLGGKLATERAIGLSGFRFKADAEAPLLTIMPNAHFPASGEYEVQTRASFTLFDRGKISLHLEPGLEASEEHLHDRSDINGIYAGPVVAALLSGTIGSFGNRTMSLMAEASPLAGQKNTPYFHSWDWSAELSLEMIKGDAEKRWDLVVRFRDLDLNSPSLPQAKSTQTTLGIRTGF